MNKVIPNAGEAVASAKNFFSHLGVVGSIVLVVGVLAGLYLIWDSASNKIHSYVADRQIEQLTTKAEQSQADAVAAKAEADQFKGAAAAYKQQGEAVQAQLTELQNARPELQQASAAAGQRVEQIRAQSIRPIDGNIQQRVDALGSELDRLYPDK